ncbi:MAG TPA: hypothetical protein VHE30_04735 [Polyangiaceae bacterium]|nr:hypothetical protein [Polyangiaceae bacterium]
MSTVPSERGVLATRVLAAIVVALAVTSVAGTVKRVSAKIPYEGMHGMSAPWNEVPRDESSPWYASRGYVPPPPGNADHAVLEAWLGKHYPALGLAHVERSTRDGRPVLDLGGGPPRVLYVEPGEGLVARPP